ncbi:tRNA (adenosine(37)-N6)-threonylcarbamoyltransferase complex ATPase subunit type 1 TsaE [Fulvivirga sp. RKSG066]|uniref:tRNA (adenosine(37)-N6)-threonylcarbamoyltransferase complex ATPase subunit type 1 TsaE n=1 Tax=Fulvivirga aurantia TaxID=2529383 RepID=UPI0012BCA2ED|nr:tRNA (adenosine(37)-N6)-threonylcarbamoyltransferase complex ATPase subunit type 1 TsaE [Fulvivirga aurantia]MTI20060.1 tRNA (adenosine(37)-N6)-threonylcarbamoyltransferase complex ATPase subunit type 1 TsaE [Fulvivirga aurantia]
MVDKALSRQEFKCNSIDQIEEVAGQILKFASGINIWLFEGEMGAGKTTLIKAICKQLNVEDTVNSPTFSIVNEYQNNSGSTFYHFDFYRIKEEEEAIEIGVYEYFDSGNLCFIEWPSKIENLLPEKVLKIDISVTGKEQRSIEICRYE